MRFEKGTIEAVRRAASLKFWDREIGKEVMRAAQGSSGVSNALPMLGSNITQEAACAVTDRLVATGFSDFLDRAPGIAPYFQRRMESIERYLEEFVANANAYEKQISQELLGGKTPDQVLSIDQVGSTYKGARGALVITTDAGKFLYKPHPMRYITPFGSLCDKLLPGKTHVPRIVDCGSACFCEFVESRPPADSDELREYYESLGGYAALSYLLCLSDQHACNILRFGPKLAPIDVETILLAPSSISESPLGHSIATLDIFCSIVGTNMFDYSHDCLTGSVVSGTKSQGTAPIGTSTEVVDHLDVIEEAFVDAFRTCLGNKRAICEAIRSLADTDLRIIMGPNRFYYGLQSRFFKLEGWDEESRLRNFDDILRSPRLKKTNESVFEYEHAILLEHDIPYFTVKAGGTDLTADGATIWPNYFSETPIDAAIRRVEQADVADLERQRKLLRKLVGGMPRMSKERIPCPQKQNAPLTKTAAVEEAGRILQQLFDDTIDFGPDGRSLMAFGNALGSYDPMDASLAWGYAGVGCFAAGCLIAHAGDAEVARKIIDMCLAELDCVSRKYKDSPELLSIGSTLNLKSGMAGYLRALQIIWAATHHDKARQVYADLLKLLEEVDFSSFGSTSALDALAELVGVVEHAAPGLPRCSSHERMSASVRAHNESQTKPEKHEPVAASNSNIPELENRDDLARGNAAIVEELIAAGMHEQAGLHLAAMVARSHKTGNYIHKGAWRVPYFDPTLFHGATGVGYELLRYARPDVIEPLFV